MTIHWAVRLQSFDPEDAPKTLLAQHDLLQLLVDSADQTLTLTIRIVAKQHGPDVDVSFFLICEGRAGSAALAKALHDVASVGLLGGYGLTLVSPDSAVLEPEVGHQAEIQPRLTANQTLPIKPDWSQVFDLLRRRGKAMTIDLQCRYTKSAHGTQPAQDVPILGADLGTSILQVLAGPSDDGHLILAIKVSEPRKINVPFALALGRKFFGTSCRLAPLTDTETATGTAWRVNEALRVWHWPYGEMQGRGLGPFRPSLRLVGGRLPTEGISLGRAWTEGPRYDEDREVLIDSDDRMRHLYIVGKTGSGKTNLLKRLARQDIEQGKGCMVISPHADLIDHLIDTAGERLDDIIYLDFGDPTYVPQVNPLAVDVESPMDYARAAEQLTDLISGLNYHEFSGPVFRDSVRTALATAALAPVRGDLDPAIAVAVEIVRDRTLREWAAKVAKETRRDIELDLSLVSDLKLSDVSEYVRWVTAKFGSFTVNGPLRSVTTTAPGARLSFREIYQQSKVLLVHLPDTYLVGDAAEFVGRFIFERLYQEARRTQPSERKDFYIHADEFQRFVNRDLEVLVTEARKFRLGLSFAHQNLRQLEAFSSYEGSSSSRLAEAIFSNAGTLVAMKTSGSDVPILARELEVREQYVRRIGQYEALVRPTLAGAEQRTFTLRIPHEVAKPERASRRALRNRMIKEGYWAKRADVEHDLDRHLVELRSTASPLPKVPTAARSASKPTGKEPERDSKKNFLDDWLARRKEPESVGVQVPESDDMKVSTNHGQ